MLAFSNYRFLTENSQAWYSVLVSMGKVPIMGATRRTTNLPAIDADSICEAALELTKQFGIDGWSIRQLAKAIKAHPSIVNYHVGRREDVVHLVIDRVNAEIDLPEYDGDWKAWFRLLLGNMRRTLRKYPGVSRRLAAVGPGLGKSSHIIDCGIRVLDDAGFGDQSGIVYSLLLCQTCAFIAAEDDRDKMGDVRKETGAAYASALSSSESGVATLAKTVKPLVEEESLRKSFFDRQFSILLNALLDGLDKDMLKDRSAY